MFAPVEFFVMYVGRYPWNEPTKVKSPDEDELARVVLDIAHTPVLVLEKEDEETFPEGVFPENDVTGKYIPLWSFSDDIAVPA